VAALVFGCHLYSCPFGFALCYLQVTKEEEEERKKKKKKEDL
jgi:hypothetical protein